MKRKIIHVKKTKHHGLIAIDREKADLIKAYEQLVTSSRVLAEYKEREVALDVIKKKLLELEDAENILKQYKHINL